MTGPRFKGQEGNTTPAAAKHALVVTVELVAPLELVVLTTVTVQVTWKPAVMGKSGGLHCATAGAPLFAAEATVAVLKPMSASEAKAVPAAIATRKNRRTLPARDPLGESFVCAPLELEARRRELRKQRDDNDQADHTVGPPSNSPEINNRLRRTFEVMATLL